jgi:hypothetical protein
MLDTNASGVAEAFQYTASASGTATELVLYVDPSASGLQIIVGVYSDVGNSPGSLLAQGSINLPVNGAWNTFSIPPTTITAGTSYWIAVVVPHGLGTVAFRDVPCCGRAQGSSQTNLTTLPATWSPGGNYPNSPLSAYLR